MVDFVAVSTSLVHQYSISLLLIKALIRTTTSSIKVFQNHLLFSSEMEQGGWTEWLHKIYDSFNKTIQSKQSQQALSFHQHQELKTPSQDFISSPWLPKNTSGTGTKGVTLLSFRLRLSQSASRLWTEDDTHYRWLHRAYFSSDV